MPEAVPSTFRARVEDVVDGDTLDVVADCGLGVRRAIRLRLDGVDTAEVYGVDEDSREFARGAEQSAFVREWVSDAQAAEDVGEWPLAVEVVERGKYGRWVSRVRRRSDGEDLTERLREEFERLDT